MIDRHLAELYGVKTKVLNQAVRRNLDRFPNDFMFQQIKELKLQVDKSDQGTNMNWSIIRQKDKPFKKSGFYEEYLWKQSVLTTYP